MSKLPKVLKWCHDANGHPGPERTLLFFVSLFFSNLTRRDLMTLLTTICKNCEVCLKSRPNTSKDRGLVGALPIPSLSNDIVYVDFISMNDFDNHNYVLTTVDGLTKL